MGQRARRRVQVVNRESPLAIVSGVVTIVAAIVSPIIAGWQGVALSAAIISLAALALVFWRVHPKSKNPRRLRDGGLIALALVAVALLVVVGDWKSITSGSPGRTLAVQGAINEVYSELQQDTFIVSHKSASDVFFDLQVGAFRADHQTLAGAVPEADLQRLDLFYRWAACGVPCAAQDANHNLQKTRLALRSAKTALTPFVR
jgi:hypothetical protein